MGIRLELTKRTDKRLLSLMSTHYSQPKGFVGRNRCFAVYWDDVYYGHIVGGSASMHLVGRDAFFGISKLKLNTVINNVFYSISKVNLHYPLYNFTSRVVCEWRKVAQEDWYTFYGDEVIGFETLVEIPRTGDLYLKDGWVMVGQTKGQTCKRTAGKGTDSWTGKRVWDTKNLRPKLVLCRKV